MTRPTTLKWLVGLLKVGMIVPLLLFMLLVPVLGWLLATETGSRWLLQTALSNNDRIGVATIQGTLLDQITLRQLRYRDEQDFSVTTDLLRLQWQAADLLRGHLHIRAVQLRNVTILGTPAATEEEQSNNEIPHIPLTISVDRFVLEQLRWSDGDRRQAINSLALQAKLDRNRLTLSDLALAMPHWQVKSQSNVTLQADWPLSAELEWNYFEDQAALNGKITVSGSLKRYDIASLVEGAAQSRQSGYVSLSGPSPEFSFAGDWQRLRWPLSGAAQVSSRHGEFHIEGSPQQYRAELNALIAALDQPEFNAAFTGHGGSESIAIERLLLKPAQGQIELQGSLSWGRAVAFDLALAAQRLNPTDFGTGVPGRLDLKAQAQGSIVGEQYRAKLNIEQLQGTLYEQPLSAGGSLRLDSGRLDIDRFHVNAGRNKLSASGYLNEQRADIALDIAAPDLRSAWPKLAGSLNGKAAIKGSLPKPAVTAELQGHNLRFNDNRIAKLALSADYEPLSSRPSRLNFSASGAEFRDNKIERISLQGHGIPDRHQVRLDLDSSLVNLRMRAEGHWDGKQWRGKFGQFAIDHPQLKSWRLQAPLLVTLAGEPLFLDLPTSCWLQDKSRLCLAAKGNPEQQLNGSLGLTDWPLAAFQPWLPQDVTLDGPLSAQGQFSSTGGDVDADLAIDLPQGRARYQDEDNVNHEQTFSISDARVGYHRDELAAHLRLGLGAEDYIAAELGAGKAGRGGDRYLDGTLSARIGNLKLLDGLLPDINRLQGLITADLTMAGSSASPLLSGNTQWNGGSFTVPRLGTEFRNIQVKAESSSAVPERLLLHAKLESGQGQLNGSGHLDLSPKQGFPFQFTLNGKQFQIARLPEAEIEVSPNININKQGNLTEIDGLVKIDKAKVELKTLPESAIAPSSDEVIVNAEQPHRKVIDPSRLHANLAIDFGEDSRFEGFGLKTRLSGKLNYIIDDERQSMLGRALMQDATYRSYGQDLTIRKGEFVFNGPADNPWLTVEAIRKAIKDDVTAVLSVTGPLKSPQTKVFTEPALPESEALSYLVTGKSTQWLGKGEGNAVASAAFNYGVGQLSWLSDRLGIDEFEFEEGDTIEDSAIRLGEYINPDLYLGVTMGLFSNKYAADVRYRLSKHFSINTSAGETQRIDLKYHLETE
ncbi:translocation/assembly module TamB domain-containing protein [Methylomarinum vadi]|uniref:translocation/assembly module TamB domain-containing protein n=1 Tax=Methylomarinum vadi TaxID=438855 RepID=UPI0004DFBDF0|nr:translocation/assembly module TamB domain-containing protein [Methylomarinum vadi]